MKILINSEDVDFSLDENLSLSTIIDEVAQWAQEQNLYILDYRYNLINETPMSSPKRDDLESVEFLVGDHSELLLSHLSELEAYIDRVGMFLAQKAQSESIFSGDEADHFYEGLKYIREAIAAVEKHAGEASEEFEASLISLENSTGMLEKLQALALIRNRVSLWVRQLGLGSLSEHEIEKLIVEFAEKLSETEKSLEKIAADLTIGKEAEALAGLEPIVEFLSDGLALLSKGAQLPSCAEKLVSLLAELTAALDAADMVTAADIVDFDLRESVVELANQIKR